MIFGLIGKTLKHSFSKSYFNDKFQKENLAHEYQNFELASLDELPSVLNQKNLKGLNVTVPYKSSVIPLLTAMDPVAQEIGAVNTIKRSKEGWKGYNTDWIGFSKSIAPFLTQNHTPALILGTGGASKAIAYALKNLGIDFQFVSRTKPTKGFTYNELSADHIKHFKLIVNCSPVGQFPGIADFPKIPFEGLSPDHLVIDLIYNPIETKFLSLAKAEGATVLNGYDMLVLQAEAAWQIWQD